MTTLATAQDFALARGLDFDPTDTAAAVALEGASAAVRGYCSHDFVMTTGATLTVDGTGTDALVLPARNISVTTVVEEDETLDTDEYVPAIEAGILYRVWPHIWHKGRRNIVVTCDWGWDTVPPEVQMVTIALATRIYTTATAGGATVSQEAVGRYSVTYDTGAGEGSDRFSPIELSLLERFRIRSVK